MYKSRFNVCMRARPQFAAAAFKVHGTKSDRGGCERIRGDAREYAGEKKKNKTVNIKRGTRQRRENAQC